MGDLTTAARAPVPPRPRVAVIHLVPEWSGGGEAVALASVEALKDDYDVTLVGWTRPDLDRMHTLFGIALHWSDVRWQPIPPARWLERLAPERLELVRRLLHPMRFCRALAGTHDLLISTFNEMDLGRPSIQYCHHPSMAAAFYSAIAVALAGRTYRPSSHTRRFLRRVIASMTGYRERRVRRNVTLANSLWTARLLEQAYGTPVRVVYPPVCDVPDQVPWDEREHGFVCVGRFVRSKRIHDVIEILSRVRARGIDVHLHVVSSYADPEYFRELEPTLRAHSAWIHLEWDLDQDRVFQLLARHRYGVHAMENEHFGIAIAEMVKAGMIPFVPDSGGQVEIVTDPRLIYTSLDDAAAKIAALLGDARAQRSLLEHLARQGAKFSRTLFASELRAVVARCLHPAAPGR